MGLGPRTMEDAAKLGIVNEDFLKCDMFGSNFAEEKVKFQALGSKSQASGLLLAAD